MDDDVSRCSTWWRESNRQDRVLDRSVWRRVHSRGNRFLHRLEQERPASKVSSLMSHPVALVPLTSPMLWLRWHCGRRRNVLRFQGEFPRDNARFSNEWHETIFWLEHHRENVHCNRFERRVKRYRWRKHSFHWPMEVMQWSGEWQSRHYRCPTRGPEHHWPMTNGERRSTDEERSVSSRRVSTRSTRFEKLSVGYVCYSRSLSTEMPWRKYSTRSDYLVTVDGDCFFANTMNSAFASAHSLHGDSELKSSRGLEQCEGHFDCHQLFSAVTTNVAKHGYGSPRERPSERM